MFIPAKRRLVLPLSVLAVLLSLGAGRGQDAEHRKPSLTLTALPSIAFAPARVKFSVELHEGDDDYEDFYCASVEWDWDDGTTSQWTRDCDPYRAGRSRIMRHFTAVHTYAFPDSYRPTFRLKKRDKVVGQVRTEVDVRSGGTGQD